jgi:hypothetical protein
MSKELYYTVHLNDGEWAVDVTNEVASDLSAEEIRDIAHERISRAQILFRQFSPFTDPAPYRHDAKEGWDEWQDETTCESCPYHTRTEVGWRKMKVLKGTMGCKFYYTWSPRKEWCRWTEYMRILFRQFEDIL